MLRPQINQDIPTFSSQWRLHSQSSLPDWLIPVPPPGDALTHSSRRIGGRLPPTPHPTPYPRLLYPALGTSHGGLRDPCDHSGLGNARTSLCLRLLTCKMGEMSSCRK